MVLLAIVVSSTLLGYLLYINMSGSSNTSPGGTYTLPGTSTQSNTSREPSLAQRLLSLAESYLEGNHSVVSELVRLIDEYLSTNNTPLVIGEKVLFIYVGQAKRVGIAGDWNRWDPGSDPMKRIDEKHWILVKRFPLDARLDYKFVINGNKWILDPHNPRTCMGGFGPNSELAMPGHVYPPWYSVGSDTPRGGLKQITIVDDHGRSHDVHLYLPPVNGSIDTIIYFYDGGDYLSLGCADRILDYLTYHKLIPPVAAVFVSPSSPNNRIKEYGDELEETTRFLVEKVLPRAEEELGINPSRRILVGDSLAGLIATYTMLRHPELFDTVIAQSPAYWYKMTMLRDAIKESYPTNNTVIISIGVYEGETMKNTIIQIAQQLREKGYNVTIEAVNQGHSWGQWREKLGEQLQQTLHI